MLVIRQECSIRNQKSVYFFRVNTFLAHHKVETFLRSMA